MEVEYYESSANTLSELRRWTTNTTRRADPTVTGDKDAREITSGDGGKRYSPHHLRRRVVNIPWCAIPFIARHVDDGMQSKTTLSCVNMRLSYNIRRSECHWITV